ncbi:MAG: 2TM domain-containing protein [Bacteroidales bacterium]|nr:2TM domain-containing protein [Bacteroidales bacterium]
MEETENKSVVTSDLPVEEEAKMQNVSKRRVHFKVHLTIFLVINLIIWALWFTLFDTIVTDAYINMAIKKAFICITLVWLLVVLLHYFIAYKWNKTFVEKELAKLKKQREKQLQEIEKIKVKMDQARAKNPDQPQE